jgi:hypothetical protein
MDDNPNYLVLAADDYIQEILAVINRAGVMVGVTAIVGTTLLLLGSSSDIRTEVKFFQYLAPLVQVLLSFFFYIRVTFNTPNLAPYSYLKNLASERLLAQEQDPVQLNKLRSNLELVRSGYSKRSRSMQWGHSFLMAGLGLLAIVNIWDAKFVSAQLGSNPFVTGTLVAIVAVLSAALLRLGLFKTKSITTDITLVLEPQKIYPVVIISPPGSPSPTQPTQGSPQEEAKA